MSNGTDIAAEIDAALREAAAATGDGAYVAMLHRTTGGSSTPWGTEVPSLLMFPLTVLEDGVSTRYSRDAGGALIPRTARVVTVSATGEAPQVGDEIGLADGRHEVVRVNPVQPGGVALLFECEISQ